MFPFTHHPLISPLTLFPPSVLFSTQCFEAAPLSADVSGCLFLLCRNHLHCFCLRKQAFTCIKSWTIMCYTYSYPDLIVIQQGLFTLAHTGTHQTCRAGYSLCKCTNEVKALQKRFAHEYSQLSSVFAPGCFRVSVCKFGPHGPWHADFMYLDKPRKSPYVRYEFQRKYNTPHTHFEELWVRLFNSWALQRKE